MEGFSPRSRSMGASMGVSLRRASKYRHDFGLLWAQRRETPVLSPSKLITFPTKR